MMNMKAMHKDFWMEIRKSKARFISIFMIVALGVAFFSGIQASSPDMRFSGDAYYDETNLMDIKVVGTLGLTEDDVAAIKQVDGVENAEGAYGTDVMCGEGEKQKVLHVEAVDQTMNRISVTDGKAPEKSGEIFLDCIFAESNGYKVGDQITLKEGGDSELLKKTDYTVVGLGESPLYISYNRGNSTLGSGEVNGFAYVLPEDFDQEVYTQIYVQAHGAQDLISYTDAYDSLIERVQERVEGIEAERCQVRYDEIVEEANDKLADARQELEDGKKEANEKLADARQELEDGKKKLKDGKKEYKDGKKKLADAKKELEDGKARLADAKKEVAEGQTELADAKTQVSDGEKELDAAKDKVADGEKELADAKTQLADGQNQINQAKQQISDGEASIAAYNTELDNGRKQLESAAGQLADAKTGLETLKSGIEQMENALNASQTELDASGEALKQARTELEANRGKIDGYRTLVATMDSQITALQAQMDLLAGGSKEWQTLNTQMQELITQRDAMQVGIAEFDQNEALLLQNEAAYEEGKKALDAKWAELATLKKTYDSGMADYTAGMSAYEDNLSELNANQAKLNAQKQVLTESKQTIAAKEQELASAQNTIAENEASLDSAKAEIAENEKKLNDAQSEINKNEKKLADAKNEIKENEQKLTDGQAEYDAEYEENHQKIEDAKADIMQAKADLADIEVPEWYVLDRNYITTCVAYAQDSERIGNIGNVFPVIFFLVAALVSLTTMTRMVEEERVQIGTLKALGYRKSSIAAKYVMYAFLATMLGGTIGTLIGQIIFPAVIMNAYKIAYVTLTDFVTPIHLKYSLISMIAAVVSTTAATLAACYKELLAAPAELMRPAAPKIGKRVFLEKITFIWKHLNFSNKAAVRNLFRYKKRLFMTILGIGGCMGLLLVGFGVKDSIMTIGDRQYNFIHTYQVKMTLADADTDEEKQEVLDSVLKEPTTKAAMLSHESTIDACCGANGEKKQSTYLFIPSDADELDEFVSLQNRISGQKYTLDDEGVVISEKLATLLDVSEGDDIYLEVSSLNYKPVKVMHIAENYYYHYVYMTPECYQSLFGKDIEYDEIFVVNKDPEDISYENDFSAKYLDNNAVSGITFTRTISDRIESMITSMNIVTYVLVVSAGLLAFIVLYNLNNINISERQRELATLKVLGFYDGEISMYVFRENIMLTVLGTIFGIFFGIWLHRFVILTAELDIMMFGRQIYTKSYIYSILLTIGFSIIVNIVMHWKMKKIDMIESLKSVE